MISNVNNNTSFSARISKETYNKIQRLPRKSPYSLGKTESGHLNIAAQVDINGGTLHIIDPQAKLYLFTLLGKNRKILNTVTSFIDGNPQKKSLEPLTNKEAQQRIDQIFNRVRV